MKSLKSRKDFSDLRNTGKTFRPCSWLLLNYATNTNDNNVRLGLTLSAGVANSVVRNKLKRWCRDYFRQTKDLGLDVNLVFLKQKNPKFFKELTRDEFDKVLDKFIHKIR